MKTLKLVLILGGVVLANYVCAQVAPFTRTYDLYPDQTGEFLISIEKTTDDGYIVAYNQNEWFDVRTSILKLDKYGEVEWHRILDEIEFPQAYSYSVCVDSQNNYYLAGYFQKSYFPTFWDDQNGFVAKYNCNGDYIWGKSYGSMPLHETDSSFSGESVYNIISYDSNMLIVAGSENYCIENGAQLFGGKPWIFAIDTSGNLLWEWNDCEDTVHVFGNFYGISKTNNGNIVAAGNLVRRRIAGNYDAPMDNLGFIGIFDNNGLLLKRKSWMFLEKVSIFYDIKSLKNNDIAIVAYTSDTLVYEGDKHERLSLIIFNESLEEKYQYNINVGGQGGYARLSVDLDSNIFIIGATIPSYLIPETEKRPDMLIAKFNQNAELLWKYFVGSDSSYYELCYLDVVTDNDGGASFCSNHGILNTNNGGSYLYKVNEYGEGIYPLSNFPYPADDTYIIYNNIQNETFDEIGVYPNPATNELIINLPDNYNGSWVSLISLSGKTVLSTKIFDLVNYIDTQSLNNGIYILKLEKEGRCYYRKIVICK
jgi:hypothetical protein